MSRKTVIALFAIAAIGLASTTAASARGGRGGGGGFHGGGGRAHVAGGGYHGGGRYAGAYYRRGVGRGLAAGAIAGAAIGAGYAGYGYGYSPDESYGYTEGGPVADDGSCAQRYRSYDPASGTYLGYDGQRHPCP
jgi:hypothetical protein